MGCGATILHAKQPAERLGDAAKAALSFLTLGK
jgi:hypothetical protein